jgi:plasmid stabilization system protein ParE
LSIRVVFHRLAAKEAREAEAWYAIHSAEAAARFRSAVLAAAQRIADRVQTHRIGLTKFWYVRLHRFPYRLIFVLEDSFRARVLAVAHGRRRPGYWRRRQ